MTGRGWQNDSFDTELLASVFGERFDRLMTVEVRPVSRRASAGNRRADV